MNVAAQAAILGAVSTGWKWIAVLIGIGVLVIVGLIAAVFTKGKIWQLVDGADGRPSTSKFQWLVWLAVILFGYAVLWVLRAKQGDYTAISQVPVNLLTVLGFSTGTAAIAKGITAGYVQSGRMAKPTAVGGTKGGLVQDDSGVPDLGKLQMIAFTLVAVGIFVATLIHQVASTPVITTLPNIDSSLLVLMGISHGGYLGKKLVTFNSPVLYPLVPATADAGESVTVTGASLGTPPAGSAVPDGAQLTLEGQPVLTSAWSATAVTFTAPAPASATATTIQVAVIVMGQKSNSVPLTISPGPRVSADGAVEPGAALGVGG